MLSLLQRLSISPKHREDLYRALGRMAEGGLPQFEVLQQLERDFAKTKHPLAPLLRVLVGRLNGSISRAGAPAQRTVGTELKGLVPDAEATLIQAGIQSGRIAQGFFNAADSLESQGRLKKAVLASIGKPLFYVAGGIALLIFFSIKVLPAFDKAAPRAVWPQSAQVLGSIADNIAAVAGGVFGLLVGGALAIGWLAPRWIGSKRDFADRHVFPFTLMAQISGASLLKSVSCYIGAGFPILEAVKQIGQNGSPYLANHCARIHRMASDGRRFEEGLVALPIIHPRYHWLINVYGLSTDAAAAYRSIAEEMSELTQRFVKNLFDRVISNVMLLMVGFLLIWIYTSMFAIADVSSKKRSAILEHEERFAAVLTTAQRSA